MMKLSLSRSASLLAAGLFFMGAARAQTFTDLNFEQATIVPTDAQPEVGYGVDAPIVASAALPGWTVELGSTPISVINGVPDLLDITSVQLVGEKISFSNGNATLIADPGSAIDGNFSVSLYGVPAGNGFPSVAAISQVGQIPADAKSIEFLISEGSPVYTPGPGLEEQPTVTFDGNFIDVAPLSESNGVITMIGDVSQYAGMTGPLTFSAIPIPYFAENEYALDDISFSTQAAPEPSSWVLSAIAAAALAIIPHQCKRNPNTKRRGA